MKSTRLVIAAGVLVAALAAGGLYYRHVHSPEYALLQIQKAVRAHDVRTFEKHVDVERTSSSLVDQMVAYATAEAMRGSEGQNGMEAMGAAMGAQLLQGMKPAMVQAVRTGIGEAVKNGSVDSAFARPSGDGPDVGGMAGGLGAGSDFQGLEGVRRSGNSAIADFRVRPELLDTTLVVSAKMERVDGTWRVVGPDNLGAFMQTVTKLQERRLAAVNDSASRRIAQAVEFGEMRREIAEQDGRTYLYLDIPVRNRGTVPVTWAALIFNTGGRDGVQVTMKEQLAPGQTGTATGGFEYNQFIEEQHSLYEGETKTENAVSAGVAVLQGPKPDSIFIFPGWKAYQSYRATHRR